MRQPAWGLQLVACVYEKLSQLTARSSCGLRRRESESLFDIPLICMNHHVRTLPWWKTTGRTLNSVLISFHWATASSLRADRRRWARGSLCPYLHDFQLKVTGPGSWRPTPVSTLRTQCAGNGFGKHLNVVKVFLTLHDHNCFGFKKTKTLKSKVIVSAR